MAVNRSKPFYKGSLGDLRNKVMNPTDEIGIFFLVGFPRVKSGRTQYTTEAEEAVCLYTWVTDSMGLSYIDNGYSQVKAANAGWWVLQMRSRSSYWGVGEGIKLVRAIALQQQVLYLVTV